MQDAGGMGLEADNHRVRVLGLRSPHDLVDNVAVSAMRTVEVTDGEDGGHEAGGVDVRRGGGRCTPSNVPTLRIAGPKSRGTSSRWRKVCMQQLFTAETPRTPRKPV